MQIKNEFRVPYIGIDPHPDYDLLYGLNGEFSVVISMVNPVVQYSGAVTEYDEFHGLFNNIIKILGNGYLLQKQDILSRSEYPHLPAEEYLQGKYNAHFAGRSRVQVFTYLSITRQVKKGSFYQYDPKSLRDFRQAVDKVIAILESGGTKPRVLREKELNVLIKRILGMNFSAEVISLDNFAPCDTHIGLGERAFRSISLVDIDAIELPGSIAGHTMLGDNDSVRSFPVDLLSFLVRVPDFDCILYNQVIEIPEQATTLRKLTLKRKRHSGIPDPANLLCVEDIDLLLKDVAKDNQLLVNAHYNIIVCAGKDKLQPACNFVESSLFQMGIIPGKNTYNQLELFRTAIPGNGVELKAYDWFLTTCDAALCFLYKESLPVDDPSDFLIRFTDRQGIPVGIDVSDLMMQMGRIVNRNKFICGPSGSGKSYFVNNLVEQYMLVNMDVVIVDVGHSYSGLCKYYGGKYITYTEQKPITMNPFSISEDEYNIEKKDFLITLVCLLWRGAEGTVSHIERDVISLVISSYYTQYFGGGGSESLNNVSELSFNTFYEYALGRIPEIKAEEQIPFDVEEFRFVLKKFYKDGEFQSLLNESADKSLLSERLIIYEIDSVQDNKILFPIITVIIIDLFIQKMRHRKTQRKALILEEAWKAITSPIMAGFLLYLNKTVRKFWGEIIEVTQSLSDIIGNPILKDCIISESDTVILLDQRKFKDKYDEIAALLSISDTERKKIFTINQLDNKAGRSRFNEVYIRRGKIGEVYGVEVSLAQYLTYTTEKPEKMAVEVYTDYFGTYPEGLDAFMADLKISGLSLGKFVAQVNQRKIVPASTSLRIF
ncbi:MAG TPA: TraG family conjugative transposon ATPase [Pedobacter sp.]|uniref:TraG family conjugative transposon ATPase n=1 Tax=Pedobacter sp. TaxID=1411316 RepID=UPI002B9ABBC7|nr:TraG family conjugative transposon ATPase [Pedobacter sp.]HMI04859.1 TraG family conjugative transposon ATPase [Pedobacter sp.]